MHGVDTALPQRSVAPSPQKEHSWNIYKPQTWLKKSQSLLHTPLPAVLPKCTSYIGKGLMTLLDKRLDLLQASINSALYQITNISQRVGELESTPARRIYPNCVKALPSTASLLVNFKTKLKKTSKIEADIATYVSFGFQNQSKGKI